MITALIVIGLIIAAAFMLLLALGGGGAIVMLTFGDVLIGLAIVYFIVRIVLKRR